MTNRSQRSGYYQAGADIYLIMPVAQNPNDLWWTAGSGCGIAVSATGCRVSGLVLRGWDRAIQFGPYASGFRVDHCRIEVSNNGVFTVGSYPSIYPRDVVVEDNDLVNTGLWSDDQAISPSASWVHIKDKIKLADGSRYPTVRIGGAMEGVGVYLTACQNVEIRRNLIDGFQNGIGSRIVQPFDAGASSEWDIHDNRIVHIQDDAIEPEGQASNWRIYRNEVMDSTTFLSTAPVHSGPIYVWHNRVRVGLRGLARDLDGVVDGAASLGFKYSRASSPQAHVYVTGNTVTDDGESAVSGGSQFASGSGQPEFYHLVNNLIVVSRNGWEYWPGQFEERSNQFSTTDPVRGMKNLATQTTYSSFSAYQTHSGQGQGSCPLDLHDRTGVADLIDADLRLTMDGYAALSSGTLPGAPGGSPVFGSVA
jgi:hypothetical protein